MSNRIQKPTSLIVSGGRTGTEFLGRHMSRFYDSCASYHEPDCLHQRHLPRDLRFVCRNFGLREGILRKVSGRSGIRPICDLLGTNCITESEAVSRLIQARRRFLTNIDNDFVVESNYAFYGLLGILDQVFEQYTVTVIARDPRTWIQSYLKKNDRYGPYDLLDRLGLRITAEKIPGDPVASQWKSMTPAQKLAWFYGLVYETILCHSKLNPKVRIWRFEDLFESANRYDVLEEIAIHAGTFETVSFPPEIPPGILDKKVNRSPARQPDASSEEIQIAIEDYCYGPTKALGYC